MDANERLKWTLHTVTDAALNTLDFADFSRLEAEIPHLTAFARSGNGLELLKEISPRVTRVAVMFNPDTAPYAEQYMLPIFAAAPKMGVGLAMAAVRNDSDIEEAIAALGRQRSAGLVVMVDSFMVVHRKAAIGAAARHKVPAVYFSSFNVRDGGLISYGVDVVDAVVATATTVAFGTVVAAVE